MRTCKLNKKNGKIDIEYKNIFNERVTYSVRLIEQRSYKSMLQQINHLLGKNWCTTEIIQDYIDLQGNMLYK